MVATSVHCADLHLETVFPGMRGGEKRRRALADALVRIVDLACERNADALFLGGDVYEAERAGPATARFLFEQLARFAKPVFVAPGNHDPYSPSAIFARHDIPPNVRVFGEAAWRAIPLSTSDDEITVYGFAHTPAEPGRPFAHARFDRPGIRIALVHGSDEDRCPPNKRATAPFTQSEIEASGATLTLTGHYHGGYVARARGESGERPVFAYPGSPEPIRFGESNEHGALVVRITKKRIEIEAVPLARTRLVDRECALADAASESAVAKALERALPDLGANDYVRLRLHGTVAGGVHVDVAQLTETLGAQLGALEILDETICADYERLAAEPTVRGRVVR
ncbi:MAG: metallophosphoesterase family protein, partial [Candidatus Eremiobacteraeota bacterium]|nr:metallophosphoesterase family protein [Candidatus Eremiobacteraeota bacterium]